MSPRLSLCQRPLTPCCSASNPPARVATCRLSRICGWRATPASASSPRSGGSIISRRTAGEVACFGGALRAEAILLTSLENGQLDAVRRQRFGAVADFERLWRQTGCADVIRRVLPASLPESFRLSCYRGGSFFWGGPQ